MLSRDLVHVCDHELPTREEKRENKVKRKKQNIKQPNVKIQYKKRPCFFHFLQPWFLHFKLLKTSEITHTFFNLLKTDSFRPFVAVQVCLAAANQMTQTREERQRAGDGVSHEYLWSRNLVTAENSLISLNCSLLYQPEVIHKPKAAENYFLNQVIFI